MVTGGTDASNPIAQALVSLAGAFSPLIKTSQRSSTAGSIAQTMPIQYSSQSYQFPCLEVKALVGTTGGTLGNHEKAFIFLIFELHST